MESERNWRSLGFKNLSFIGQQGCETILLAASRKYPKPLAIKIMDLRLLRVVFYPEDEEFVFKQLPRELSILEQVEHPHIVKVHQIVRRSGHVYIVMETAKMNLQQKIDRHHHIPISQAKEWFSQLLSAVIYLHQQDIVHRDLKCENILLTADGQVKLTDFGCGRFSRGFPELCHSHCDTMNYCAPEQLMNKPYDAKKCDVWSLGVVLYSMVTGITPYNPHIRINIPRDQPGVVKFPSQIPVEESCRDLISSMLEFDPCDRPSAEAVAQHPWLKSAKPVNEDEGSRSGLFSATKITAKAKIVEPKITAFQIFQRRMGNLFNRRNSSAVADCSSSKTTDTSGTDSPGLK